MLTWRKIISEIITVNTGIRYSLRDNCLSVQEYSTLLNTTDQYHEHNTLYNCLRYAMYSVRYWLHSYTCLRFLDLNVFHNYSTFVSLHVDVYKRDKSIHGALYWIHSSVRPFKTRSSNSGSIKLRLLISSWYTLQIKTLKEKKIFFFWCICLTRGCIQNTINHLHVICLTYERHNTVLIETMHTHQFVWRYSYWRRLLWLIVQKPVVFFSSFLPEDK
jgi:hypothetical protein